MEYNETTFEIDGKEYSARPDFKTVSRIERKLKKNFVQLSMDVGNFQLLQEDLLQIIHIAISGQSEKVPTIDEIGEYMFNESKVPDLTASVGEFLTTAFVGSKELKKKIEENDTSEGN